MSLNNNIQPIISIIIPTYNRANFIGETLDSILNQTYANWECIIVDDGSIDNTLDVVNYYIRKDNRFKYQKRPDNKLKGPSSCRNYGFELSKGKFIHWFDSDDLYLPNALENYINEFSEKTDVVIAKLEKVDFKSGKKFSESRIISDNIIEDYFVGKISFYVCGPLWRKSFLDKQIFLFDETISNLDDWDFNLRMLYQNPIINYINIPLIKYRFHEDSLSKEIFKLNFDELISKFKAMENHLNLISIHKKEVNILILKKYFKNRYKFILRLALMRRDTKKKYFLKKLLIEQVKLLDVYDIIKTILGYIFFSLFNKGYMFFK